MAGESKSKLNQLLHTWCPGTVAVLPWLETQGVYQQLAYEYERSGWLKRVGRGAYIRSGDTVDWPGALYAIQKHLGQQIHVGGKSALELKGLGHFSATGDGHYLYLFGGPGQKLPSWFLKHKWGQRIAFKMPVLFESHELGLTSHSFAGFDVRVSTPERAALEVLHLVPNEQSIEEAALLMEGLGNLRPKIVQSLLETCRSVKVKRLFLAFAERCQHTWIKRLSLESIDLGKGKRVVARGGVLDPKYHITLPRLEGEE